MMDKDLKDQWITALRSGNYTQGEGQLRMLAGESPSGKKRYKHCCLGVLAACVNSRGWDGETDHELSTEDGANLDGKKVGLTQPQLTTLIGMNDGGGESFDGIASWIEKKVNAR